MKYTIVNSFVLMDHFGELGLLHITDHEEYTIFCETGDGIWSISESEMNDLYSRFELLGNFHE